MSNTKMGLVEFFNIHQSLGPEEIILDVRRPDEFDQGHIPDAVNIPLDKVMAEANELKKYNKIYVHCKRGGRAVAACEGLTQAGLNNLVCIHDGGMDQWIQNGYPVAN